jgi:hypothetical protein
MRFDSVRAPVSFAGKRLRSRRLDPARVAAGRNPDVLLLGG